MHVADLVLFLRLPLPPYSSAVPDFCSLECARQSSRGQPHTSIQRSSSLKSRSRIRSYYDDGDTSDEESAASFLYEDDGSVVSKLTL